MADEMNRRQFLGKGTSTAFLLAGGLMGIDRLSRAVAAQLGGVKRADVTHNCAPGAVYGCDLNYCISAHASGCESNPHDCLSGFACTSGTDAVATVHCYGTQQGYDFFCDGPGVEQYGCTGRVFVCQTAANSVARFRCGDGTEDHDREFMCDSGAQRFGCKTTTNTSINQTFSCQHAQGDGPTDDYHCTTHGGGGYSC